jgi:hypothetical protein
MIRNALFASLIALGAAGAAQAQDHGPRLIGGGENTEVVYAGQSSNVVGGGFANLSGGSENAQIAYGPRVTSGAGNGTVARLVGGGENQQVVYEQVAPAARFLAGSASRQRG